MTSIQDVLASLEDATFPASKDELVATAERAGAPEGVVKALRAMPPVDYANRDEVARSAHTDPVG
jgi:Protein of unknown function (DUF2795)